MKRTTQVSGLVSINMPFLNTPEKYLREAIASAYAQTYREWELILVNDGSDAAVSQVALEFAQADPGRIRYFEHEGRQHRGISASRNLAVRHSRGEFIGFLDSDDCWDATQLQEQVNTLREQPMAEMVYGNTLYWCSWSNGDDDASDFRYDLMLGSPRLFEPPELLERILCHRTISPCMTSILARRRIFEAGVEFDDAFPGYYEDQVFLAQVLSKFPVYVDNRVWGRYRQHRASITRGGADLNEAKKWRLEYLAWLQNFLAATAPNQRSLQRALWRERLSLKFVLLGRVLHWCNRQIRRINTKIERGRTRLRC